ncbi:MAG: hypothetical protein KC910_36270, partial [Candidatus Eremiobacteraeota bacterium]|nr:hypothetical protein [Candidatus Eremiobacteraeota bacterium]
MIRIRCEDCGAWHSGELAFCPYCDTMHAGGLSGNESIAVYEKASSRFLGQLMGSLLYRRNLAQWLDWAGSLVRDLMGLLLEPPWVPCWYGERTSFAPLEVDKLFGLDLARLKGVDQRFERLGFCRSLDFTIPEEHRQSLYRLYLLPGESTWALVRIPSPADLRAARWELSFHSRLKGGGALVTQPMALAGPTPEGKVEFLFGPPRPEDLFGLHRQETFRRGGALPVRGRARPGTFYRHYALVTRLMISHRVGLGLLKRGRG